MKRKLIQAFYLFIILLSIVACDPDKVIDEYHTIHNSSWDIDSVQNFTFSIYRKDQVHNIYFNIRNDRSYEFCNLWLFVTIDPPGGVSKTDTVQVMLADPSGKWMGKGFSGVYDNRRLYMSNVYFPEPGNYSIHLRHGMRPTRLKGITDIGIRVEKVN
jgi:gliding motility-associated lipoprotein GldH